MTLAKGLGAQTETTGFSQVRASLLEDLFLDLYWKGTERGQSGLSC